MKYYHIIYNSSQRSQDGTAGLGIRTYTKGTPMEYMDLLKENEFFNYSSGNLSQPSPKTLMEDGKIILNYPATYRFAKLFSSDTGKDIYVLSRTVSVGFDYPYYVKFVAARVDNFVTDAYIFEEQPTDEAFEILYENPGMDSVGFIPRDRVPSPENEEMRELSLGEMALLEAEEKPFVCQRLRQVSELSFELLFAYLESCRLRLPLLVKCAQDDAPALMADLIRLLPPEMRKDISFYTNYQLEGVKEGYKVFFVNEHYKYDFESNGQFYVFDITQNAKVTTDVSNTYREEWKQLFFDGNDEEYLKSLHWVTSPAYDLVRGKGDATKRVFFGYLVDPKSFNFNQVYHGDEELLTSLSAYFAKDHSYQQLFDKQLEAYLVSDKISGNDFLSLLKFVDKLESKGFNLTEVIAKVKKAVSAKLLETPEVLKTALDSVGLERLSKYFDKQVFEGKKEYLDSEALKKDWPKVYKYFYPVAEQNDHVKILAKMLSLNLPENVVDEVIKGFGISDIQLCDYFAEVAKTDSSDKGILYKRIKDILENLERKRLELPKSDLAEKIDKYVLTPLMKDSQRPSGIESCHELMQLLSGKFDEQNAAALAARALKINTKQVATLLFEKGLKFVKGKDLDAVVDQIVNLVKPEKTEFLIKAERLPNKVQLLAAYFKKSGDSKKTIEKLRKEGKLNLSDNEFEDLISKVIPAKDKDSDDSRNVMMVWLKRLIAPVVAVLLVVCYFVFLHHPKTEEVLKFEAFTPAGEFTVKEVINGLTAASAVPEGAKVGDIYADKVKGDDISYFKVVAEQKKEAEPEPSKEEVSKKEEKEQEVSQPTETENLEGQQPEEQQTDESPLEVQEPI